MKPDSLYDEKAADKEVISSLLRHIKKITKENRMPLFKDENGSVSRAVSYEPVSREELVANFEKAQRELNEYDSLNSAPEVKTDEQSAPEVEVSAQEDSVPIEPAVIDNQAQVIEQPIAQPVETEVTPEAPAPVTIA
ncbi:MAG: hypothetical protein KGZ81_07180 [Flavobacteriales bacterium]|nr:hypothetical protein [Flavobacteriales bacterium]